MQIYASAAFRIQDERMPDSWSLTIPERELPAVADYLKYAETRHETTTVMADSGPAGRRDERMIAAQSTHGFGVAVFNAAVIEHRIDVTRRLADAALHALDDYRDRRDEPSVLEDLSAQQIDAQHDDPDALVDAA
jgi:hypothetical protein